MRWIKTTGESAFQRAARIHRLRKRIRGVLDNLDALSVNQYCSTSFRIMRAELLKFAEAEYLRAEIDRVLNRLVIALHEIDCFHSVVDSIETVKAGLTYLLEYLKKECPSFIRIKSKSTNKPFSHLPNDFQSLRMGRANLFQVRKSIFYQPKEVCETK